MIKEDQGSPRGSVCKGSIAQNTKGNEIRHLEHWIGLAQDRDRWRIQCR